MLDNKRIIGESNQIIAKYQNNTEYFWVDSVREE
jgi:hypothetical protein